MKTISLLGSTGSIGTQTLDVVRNHKDKFEIAALSCGRNISLLREQIREFNPSFVSVAEEKDADTLAKDFPNLEIGFGEEGLCRSASFEKSDCVVNALMGMTGFVPTVSAIKAGKELALANKETLVSGGEIVMSLAEEKGVKIYPIDSEHSAIFQCLQAAGPNKIKKILLTASGGPFRGKTLDELKNVTLKQALKHPNWSMGAKITIDSSTLMNKGLEVIEAATLFNVKASQVQVVVHPESAIHSAVEFEDGSIIAQLGRADMRIPIAYAISYPDRLPDVSAPLDLFELASMHFEKADIDTFKCLGLAYRAMEEGQSSRVVMNAANEIAVAAFMKEKISYLAIGDTVERCMNSFRPQKITTPEEILALDQDARRFASEMIG